MIKPEDFEPQLKREKPLVPGYWTVGELAEELGTSIRKVQVDITGDAKLRVKAKVNAIKVGSVYLVPDSDAIKYIQVQQKRIKKNIK
ncbi:DNA-binding protein [Chroococcus sp. FPU101]|uniref:DNA-binding protein n=1 Tax=Chroococcus sp. FPU101 TaxID=1974212 RepID=UPI001F5D8114|nr:DNA-binding protein [Chroococcus sp. FPU101]